MKTQNTNCILAATALMTTLLGATSICRAASASAQTPRMTAAENCVPTQMLRREPVVIIHIGDALLEEYRGGNPADRTEIIRERATVQVPKAAESSKNHS